MMYFTFFLFLFFNIEISYAELEKSPYQKYSTKNNFTNKVYIEWIVVEDIQKTCNQLRIKQHSKPFPYELDACSSWGKNFFRQNTCTIYTKNKVNNDILGHEVRHCFQGHFH